MGNMTKSTETYLGDTESGKRVIIIGPEPVDEPTGHDARKGRVILKSKWTNRDAVRVLLDDLYITWAAITPEVFENYSIVLRDKKEK